MLRGIKILFASTLVATITGCTAFKDFVSPQKSQKAAPIARVDNTQNQYYTVQSGETLYEVGKKFNITERALILWNNIPSPYVLKSGQVLRIFPIKVSTSDDTINTSEVEINNFNNIQELDDESLNDFSLSNQKIEENITKHQKDNIVISSAKGKAKLERRSVQGKYTVQPGDTLLSIAHSFNLSLSQIANLNDIDPPYIVNVGQVLIIDDNPVIATEKKILDSMTDSAQKLKPEVIISEKIVQKKVPHAKVNNYGGTQWQWPIKNNVAIDEDITIALLSGSNGQNIHAACAGEVIYSGVGVQGYGKMIIIQCNHDYISAYSNLKSTIVDEGEKINIGQIIGKLGKFKGQSELGFEIRHMGNSVKLKSIMPK